MCGEQETGGSTFPASQGSPPRVRGTVTICICLHQLAGITPACAGNSLLPHFLKGAPRDHPRVCGEQAGLLFLFPLLRGSPPRVRGTDRAHSLADDQHRITPACAGNSAR